MATPAAIVELRQYTLKPAQRDVLIALFERHFIEPQEEAGAWVIGQFRDLDDPDRFVWLRGFADMPSRAAALQAFYTGGVWRAHRDAANATMIDSDNVLLLRPACPASAFTAGTRPPAGAGGPGRGSLVTATICAVEPARTDELVAHFFEQVKPALAGTGAEVVAAYVTESSPNNFPALPVREGENVLVWFARFPDRAAHQAHADALERSPRWRELRARLSAPPQTLRLAPTARSELA
jgi:quinol monooxygenase YgiN